MKKLLLPALFIAISTLAAKAQYTDIFDFSGKDGVNPEGSLIYDGSYLYGLTSGGGKDGLGLVFRIKPDGTGDTVLHSFTGADGIYPHGSLFYDGNYLFGITLQGGIHNDGVVFRIKPNGTGDTVLHSFDSTDGKWPYYEALISDGTFLYGTTEFGGTNGDGTIFKIKPDGTNFTDLLDFDSLDGMNPRSSLLYDGTFLYGVAGGGTKNYGIIFRIKPDGTGDTILFNFYSINGHGVVAGIISDGIYLYGVTIHGGTYNYGIIYRVKPDGTGDTVLHNFTGTDGGGEYGPLLFVNKYLYGVSGNGGPSDLGVLFRIKPDGTGDTILYDFDSASGDIPSTNSLISVGTYLYGMTPGGGAYNDGVVFRYLDSALLTGVNEPPVVANEVKVYPNPSDGIFNFQADSQWLMANSRIEVYNVLGQQIANSQWQSAYGSKQIDLSNNPPGVYFYRVISNHGQLMGSGKLVIK